MNASSNSRLPYPGIDETLAIKYIVPYAHDAYTTEFYNDTYDLIALFDDNKKKFIHGKEFDNAPRYFNKEKCIL